MANPPSPARQITCRPGCAEGAQRIYSVAVHQLPNLRKRFVRYEVRIDNHLDHGRARRDAHPTYQRVDADQSANLGFVAYEGIRVEFRSFVDELLVCLFPSSFILRESCGTVLMMLSEPG